MRRPQVHPGGLCWIVFAKWEDVELWPEIDPITGVANTPIKLFAGRTWYEAKVTYKGKMFIETDKQDATGPFWDMQVTGYIGGNSTSNTLSAAAMLYHQYVVMFEDLDGQIRFIGNTDTGAGVNVPYNSGEKESSRKRTITWGWQHPNPAPIYIGGLTDIIDDVIIPPFAGAGDFNEDFSNDFNI